MRDLRGLLDEAAGIPADLPDIEMIRQRAHPRIVRRRGVLIVALMAVGVAASAGVSVIYDSVEQDRGGIVKPAPAPPEPTAQGIRPGQLEPGTYRGKVGAYSFLLDTHNDDWKVLVDRPDWVAFTYQQYVLHLQVWESIVPPESTDASDQRRVPADLVEWLVAHPRLSTGSATRLDVAGIEATQLDARVVRPLADPPDECSRQQCVVLGRVAGEGELVDVEVGQRIQFLIFGQSGQQLVLYYRAPEREFPVLHQAVQELLAGLRLTAPH